MSLLDSPPHRITVYGPPVSAKDSKGGDVVTWPAVRAAAVPCSINTLSGAEQERFAALNLFVSHRVSWVSAVAAVEVGDKLVAVDTGATLKVESIEKGRAYGGVPALTYCNCSQWAG